MNLDQITSVSGEFDKDLSSVILLKDGEKRLMIYGVKQKESNTDKIWDYVACLFPEGNIDLEHTYIFNHEQIERVYFIGFQDIEELEYNQKISEYFNTNISK